MPASDTRLPIDRWVDELARMSLPERHAAIEAYRFPANIGNLIREAAAETPDTVALSFFETGRTLTYAELDSAVDRVALAFAAHGVAFGDKVGVMLPNIPEFPLWGRNKNCSKSYAKGERSENPSAILAVLHLMSVDR